MKICKKCEKQKEQGEFYNSDSTCKECRKEMVRQNRAKNAEYYREYDKKRFKNDPRVKERHARYAASDAGKAAGSRAKKKYIEQNPIKRSAHIMVGNAIASGRLVTWHDNAEANSKDRKMGVGASGRVCKAVLKMDCNMNILIEYQSFQAAKRDAGYHMEYAIKNGTKCKMGFYWKYK